MSTWRIPIKRGDRVRATRGSAVFEFEVAKVDIDNELMVADEEGDAAPTGIYPGRGWQVRVLARPIPTTPGSVIALRNPVTFAVLSLHGWRDENGRELPDPNPEEVDVIFDRKGNAA